MQRTDHDDDGDSSNYWTFGLLLVALSTCLSPSLAHNFQHSAAHRLNLSYGFARYGFVEHTGHNCSSLSLSLMAAAGRDYDVCGSKLLLASDTKQSPLVYECV